MSIRIPLLYLLLTTAFLVPEMAHSQEHTTIKGRVLSETGKTLEAVTVLILRLPDSSLVKTSLTDDTGSFDFQIRQAGTYVVAARNLGDKTYSVAFTVTPGDKTIPVKDIILRPAIKGLKEVVISEKNPLIERKAGKMVLNVSTSNMVIGTNAMEILNRAPGIHVDKDENIVMKGKTGVMIMVDGKPTNLTAADAADLLRNTPYDAIDRIDLITNPGARYDAAGGGGIIDIRLKKGKNLGTNGSLNATMGYGNFGKIGTGVSLNHRASKLNIFGSYNYSNNKRPENLVLNRMITRPGLNTFFEVSNRDNKTRIAQNYNLGIDYFVNPRQTVGFLYNGFSQNMVSLEDNSTRISNNTLLDSNILMSSNERRKVTNSSYNFNYKGVMDNKQELTVDLDYFTYTRDSRETLENQFMDASNNAYRAPLWFQNNSPSDISIRSARIGYLFPLGTAGSLDAGIKTNLVRSQNHRIFENFRQDIWIRDSGKSDEFNFSERITAGYLTYKRSLTRRTELEAGIRAEATTTWSNSVTTSKDVNRKYLDFFPAIHLSQQFNTPHKLNLSFNRRINRPLYEDLNPFLYFLDQYNFREGNPYLKPEYTNTVEVGHIYQEKFSTTASYTYVEDIFLSFQVQDDPSGVIIQSKKNLNSQEILGLEFSTDLALTKWWNSSCTVRGNYMHFTYLSDGNTLDKHSPFYTANITNSFTVKKNLAAELMFNYESETNYGLFDFEPLYGLDLGINQSLLKNRANIRLSITDMLNTRCNRYSTLYKNLDLWAKEKAESRVARLAFTYRFGKTSVKGARKRSTGTEEESQRIKS